MQVCINVGKIILNQCPRDTLLTEFIPLYLQKSPEKNQVHIKYIYWCCLLVSIQDDPLMKQALIHLYFYALLERLQTHQFTPSQLVTMITETEKVYMNVNIRTYSSFKLVLVNSL